MNSNSAMQWHVGSMYNTGWRNIKIGMAMRNFGPDIRKLMMIEDGKDDEDPFDLFDNDGDGLVDEDGGLELIVKSSRSL